MAKRINRRAFIKTTAAAGTTLALFPDALEAEEASAAALPGKSRVVQVHGPGMSKVLIGEDQIENWRDHLDVMVESIVSNGGRSCVNASSVVVPRHGAQIAEALAERLVQVKPRGPDDDAAVLAGFVNHAVAAAIDQAVDEGLKSAGAEETTAKHRAGGRRVEHAGGMYLLPTVMHCASFDHPLANREFLFPYASVVEVPQREMLDTIGESLVVTAITEDKDFTEALIA